MINKTMTIAFLLGAAAISFADGKSQTTCPVMGGKINKKLYADVKGQRIYVCCPGCISAIKADPEKYIKKMKAAGIEPGKITAQKKGN